MRISKYAKHEITKHLLISIAILTGFAIFYAVTGDWLGAEFLGGLVACEITAIVFVRTRKTEED